MNLPEGYRPLFIVPNNDLGWAYIKELRKYRKVRLRGRHHDRQSVAYKVWASGEDKLYRSLFRLEKMFRNDIPIKYSERIAIYLQ